MRKTLLIPSLIALAAVLGAVGPARAFDLFGLKLFEDQSDKDADAVIADPQPYILEFNSGGGPTDGAVRNASELLADQAEPASGTAGLLAKAQGDYRRIMAALYGQGYYGGTISILIGGREATTIPPDAKLPDPVGVSVNVTSGPLFHFGSLRIVNQAAPTSDPADQVDPPQSVGFGIGQEAKSSVIGKAETLVVQAWRQQGYPKAEIAKREVIADHDTNLVDVVLTVAPGGLASIGQIGVQGTQNMNPDFVRRQTGLEPGKEYDPDDIELANKRLTRLQVFKALRIEAAESINPDGSLPFTIIVQEQALRRFGVGATWSTVDGFGIEGFWMHRNLFGQAERLRLDAKIASIAWPIDTAEFDYAFGGTFTKPGIFTPDTDFVAAISAERTVVETYTETSASARVGISHALSEQIAFDGAFTAERNQFEDDFGTRDFATVGLDLSATWDTRNSETDATEGFYAKATVDPFYEFYYGNAALQATVEGRAYFALDEADKYVLAARLKAGYLAGPDLSEIPPDRLFFAGGGGSVRGYGYKSIGVDDGSGHITGGRYLLEGSLEARAKITGDIGVVGFVDGGYVAADTFPDWSDLYIGAGLGIRYYTGFGPLRLDIAVPLNKRDTDGDYAIYAGIGQAF